MQDNKTILFLPDRLNRKPPVVSGMTFTELMSVIGISAIIGLFLGLLVIFVFHITWAVVPTVMVIFALIGLKFGGSLIARLKRGKPETWLERYVAYRLNPSAFITKEQHWGIHRIYSTSKRKK
ncbi:TIGR03750 family conjugal transfer protein [Actinobacillus delphinicola]|uniref:Conjugative transfer region protein n=1 Tax=Actinobacillus delphinicola TaxID=51161 RepID=A0A448TUA2_9PAST|nr:TIGR03750 family conjugal transfer protein [Actinobacillus delphinicola]VEJ09388.1 conjugative transfer region protein [Actinobacillus delphinicola]